MRLRGATVYQLGALPPEKENPLRDLLAQIDDLEQQVASDLVTLADVNVDTSSFKATYDALKLQSTQLAGEFTILTDAGIADWQSRANAVVLSLHDLLNRTGAAKSGGLEHAQVQGLTWGLGVAAAVAAISFLVWRGRRRGRRRR